MSRQKISKITGKLQKAALSASRHFIQLTGATEKTAASREALGADLVRLARLTRKSAKK